MIKSKIIVPQTKRSLLESTIADEVSDMLVRKIYGCLNVDVESKTADGSTAMTTIEEESGNAADTRLTPAELKKRLQKLIR